MACISTYLGPVSPNPRPLTPKTVVQGRAAPKVEPAPAVIRGRSLPLGSSEHLHHHPPCFGLSRVAWVWRLGCPKNGRHGPKLAPHRPTRHRGKPCCSTTKASHNNPILALESLPTLSALFPPSPLPCPALLTYFTSARYRFIAAVFNSHRLPALRS